MSHYRRVPGTNTLTCFATPINDPAAFHLQAKQVEAVFRSSISRRMSPDILYHVGMWHIRKFFGKMSVGVAEGEVWAEGKLQEC